VSDRFGPRIVVLSGAILLGAGLLVASRAITPLGFQLGFGVLVGVAAGAFFAPMIAAVTAWFDTQRALAVLSRVRRSRCSADDGLTFRCVADLAL